MGILNKNELIAGGFNSAASEFLSSKNLSYYGNISGDITNVLKLAFEDSTTTRVIIPDGNYSISNLLVEGTLTDTVIEAAPGAIFNWTGNLSPIHLMPGVQWISNISNVNIVTSVIGPNDVTQTTTHNEIVISTARTVKAGDIVRIVSDDILSNVLAGSSGGNEYRKGEIAIVAEDSTGTTIKLTSLLRDTYTTNPRIALYKKTRFGWSGGQFSLVTSQNIVDMQKDAMFRIGGMINPYIRNVECLDSRIPLISFEGCVSPRASDLMLNRMLTKADDLLLGYGVNDIASEGGVYQNITANYVRHAITTTERLTELNTPTVWRQGRTWNLVGDNVHGLGCTNGVIDTHHAAGKVTYTNCSSVGSFAGPSSGGFAITTRGNNVTIRNFFGDRCRKGINVSMVDGLSLDNVQMMRTTGTALEMVVAEVTNAKSINHNIRNCYFETVGNQPVASFGMNGMVEANLENVTFKVLTKGENRVSTIELGQAKITGKNWIIDHSEFEPASAITNVLYTYSNNVDISVDGFTLIPMKVPGSLTTEAQGFSSSLTDSTAKLKLSNVYYAGTLSMQSSSTNGNLFGVHSKMTGSVTIQGELFSAGEMRRTCYINTNTNTWNTQRIGDQHIYIRRSSSADETVTIYTTSRKNGDTITARLLGTNISTINGVAYTAPTTVRLAYFNSAWLNL